ncbi:MAG: hypothetical protein Q9218_006712 [Villophora microphyllina]
MWFSHVFTAVTLLLTSATCDKLAKPPLQPNLNNLKAGLMANLHPTQNTRVQWPAGWIPTSCKAIAEKHNFNPADVSTYYIYYDDCKDPWMLCYHKDSSARIDTLIDMFGRLPVHTRQWVRHVVSLPSKSSSAYSDSGDMVLFGNAINNINVYIHESGHCLTGQGAFKDWPHGSKIGFPGSKLWIDNYNLDSAVPDPYAQSNQVENVAQNIVVGSYQRNVPGGFHGVNPQWSSIFHQFATIDTQQRENGNLLIPGGRCLRRTHNSVPVLINTVNPNAPGASLMAPDVSLSSDMPKEESASFSTEGDCKQSFAQAGEDD